MLQVYLYFLQQPGLLKPGEADQARLNCYPIFHKACKQKLCHLANRPSHACIYSMLWRCKHCFWRRNATQHMGIFCSLFMGCTLSAKLLYGKGSLQNPHAAYPEATVLWSSNSILCARDHSLHLVWAYSVPLG